MAVTGTPSSGNDTLTGDNANDEITGEEGNDSIDGGGGNDTIYGDVQLLANGGLDSNQADNSWSLGTVDGWFNTGSGGVIERWGDGFLGLSTADGSSFIELDANSSGGLDHVQTNVELDTGVSYTLSFGHAARAGGSVNDDFQVTHNGIVVATISPSSTSFFTTATITLTGLSGTDTIGFREMPGQNNSLGVLLDNVQVSLSQSAVDAGSFTYDDTINGGAGDDHIYGQEGDDQITGGLGNDYLEGGIGNDVFTSTAAGGADTIGDFTIGQDLLNVDNLIDASGKPIDASDVVITSDGEGGSVLTFPNGESIRLVGIAPSQLDTDEELEDIGIACFASGTCIHTNCGAVDVAQLQPGSLVHCIDPPTQEITLRPLRRVLRTTVDLASLRKDPKLRPITISAGALGNQLPQRDLRVSRQHRMMVSSKIAQRMFGTHQALLPAIRLTALPGIYIDETPQSVDYFHLLFDQHEVIFAEGAPTESLFTGPEALKSFSTELREEILTLFPELTITDGAPRPALPLPSGKVSRQLIARHAKNQQPLLQSFAQPRL
ncbi:Hint domain-containing protein [Roseovarius sp. EL26]|uniref:Hint domain-containing protein n=1 Tax=Roseovarius sp. EL26 TaxID=2126672 RepID=UPI000EA0FB76|nr:Hint domain-containing protein [Roseovarius sp. EL26]